MSVKKQGVKVKPDFDDLEKIRRLKNEIKEMQIDHAKTFGYEDKLRKKRRNKAIIVGICVAVVITLLVATLLIIC